MMNIKIKETQEIKTLSIIDENGIDWVNDCIGNAIGLPPYDEETNSYEMSQEDFEWWEDYLKKLQANEEKLAEYQNDNNYDCDKIYEIDANEFDGVNDLNDHDATYQRMFERIENEAKY